MAKRKVSMLRFIDTVDVDNPIYVTIFLDGAKYGFFHRVFKKHFTDETTIRPHRKLLYEIKFSDNTWHSINRTEFMLRLSLVNTWRREKDMPIITIPEIKNETNS